MAAALGDRHGRAGQQAGQLARALDSDRPAREARRRVQPPVYAAIAAALIVAVTVADTLTGSRAVLLTALTAAPLLAAGALRPRATAALGALASVDAVVLGIPDGIFLSVDHLIRVSIVVTVSGFAVWITQVRSQREESLALLEAQAAAGRVLSQTPLLAEAQRRLLAAVGSTLGWQLGALWQVEGGVLACRSTWVEQGVRAEPFFEAIARAEFQKGIGLPGRVWETGEPAWISDVTRDPTFTRGQAAAEAGLHGAFCFPVKAGPRMLGFIEFFSSDPREPDRHLLALMSTLGTQLGAFVERRLAEEAVQASEARKTAMLEAALDAVITIDSDGAVVEFNPAAEQTFGYSRDEAIGRELAELVVPPALRDAHREGLARFLETGESRILDRRMEISAVRKDGTEFPVEMAIRAIDNPQQPLFTGFLRDITSRREADQQRSRLLELEQAARLRTERAARRASFLSEATALLTASLDTDAILGALARLSVPRIADWCAIDVVSPEGEVRRVAVAHSDPAKEELAWEMYRRWPIRLDAPGGAGHVMRTGETVFLPEIPDELLDELAPDPDQRAIVRELGLRSGMVIPLTARGRTFGAIAFSSAESGRTLTDGDREVAEELAVRAAVAVDNARLYEEQSYVARTLQASLLPDPLPEVPGLEVAARYLAAGEANEVGGDFYDLFPLGGGDWGTAIGDVRGKGPRAAAVISLVRYTLRAASLREESPSRVLELLNEAMLRERSDDRFCTVAYASLKQAEDERDVRVTLACGGHPLPIVARAGGQIEVAGAPGTLIGFVADPDVIDSSLVLRPGDVLVLYTDGVVEARRDGELYGDERLAERIRESAGLPADELAQRIVDDVLSFEDHGQSDDMAVLVLRVPA